MDVAGVVRRHRDPLLTAAFLLDGDERTAEDHVDRTLARLSPTADHAAAVRALLRTRAPRTALAEQAADPWWVAPADLAAARRTARAMADLDRPARAALVLDHAGLPTDPGALARGQVGVTGADLDGLAAVRRPAHRDDEATVARVRDLRRARWLRPVAAVAVVLALVLLAVLLPTPVPGPAPAGRFDGPARGSLAGDEQLVDAVRVAPWDGGPPVADRRVVFVGDLLGRRWSLVAAATADGWVGLWSAGPPGAPPAVQRSVTLRADRPAALLVDDALLVVADPGEEVRVSPGVVVRADATVGRVYAPVDADDGVAAVALAAPDPGGVAVRVRLGATADVPVTTAGTVDARAAVPALVPLREGGPDQGARGTAVDGALAAVAVPTGLDPGQLDPVLLWAGALPHPLGGSVDAVVLAVALPTGAVVVGTAWADRLENGTVQQVGCGSQAFPAGTDPAAVTVAARCVVADRNSGTAAATVLLTGPAGTTLLPDDPRTLTEVDGVPVTAAGPDDLFTD